MLFNNIEGLHETKRNLIDAVKKGHVAHTQLFLGPEGSANLAMAIAFATYLNCEDRGDTDSCGKCASCLKNQKYIHPDVHYVFPVSSTEAVKGKEVVSNNFLKDWRSFIETSPYGDVTDWSLVFGGENKNLNVSKEETRLIIQKLSLKAFEGQYKIIIIWMPEFMHPSAANGMLKVLEEPTANTIFLLVATDTERLLGTILSRTQLVLIRAFEDQEIASQLLANGIPEERANIVARLAAGNMKLALRLAAEADDDHATSVKEWMRTCYAKDFQSLVNWSDEFHKMPKISQRGFLRYGLSLLRDTMMIHYGDPSLIRLPEDEKEFVRKFSRVVTPEKIEPLNKLVSEAIFHLERNGSARMVFLDLSLKTSQCLKTNQFEVQH